jgi:DNA gyrase subunit B
VHVTSIDADLVAGADYATPASSAATFQGLMGEDAIIRCGEGAKMKECAVRYFQRAVKWLREDAARGVSKQRYKGLGEMNPEQFWETTIALATRRFLKAWMEDAIAAAQIFTTSMDNEIEPRLTLLNRMRCRRGILTFGVSGDTKVKTVSGN